MTRKIVDAHMHLWHVSAHDWYPGLKQLIDMHRDYLPSHYRTDAGDEPVSALVHICAATKPRAYLEESRWVSQLFDQHRIEGALIGSVDPTLAAVDIVADLEQQASLEHFRGVRVLYDFAPNSTAANTVLSWLSENGKVLDLVAQPSTMDSWIRTLQRFPELKVVLEHAGWPEGTDQASFQAWRRGISRLATETGMDCKISGLGMVTMSQRAADLRPWVRACVESFGWDRVTFGSNFPIDGMAGSYPELMRSLREILAEASPAELERFFAGNAEHIYALEARPSSQESEA